MTETNDTTVTRRYFGDWPDWAAMEQDFRSGWGEDAKPADGMATDAEVLFAVYTYENYSGSAFVLFKRDGTLYEVNGSHCSCYGLEDQWKPEVTTWAAIAMRPFMTDDSHYAAEEYTPEGIAALRQLVRTHTAEVTP